MILRGYSILIVLFTNLFYGCVNIKEESRSIESLDIPHG